VSLQDALDDLTQRLTSLEMEVQRYKSVGDLLVSDLQQNIDSILASPPSHTATFPANYVAIVFKGH